HGGAAGRTGDRVQETVGGRRESARPAIRCGPMDQGQEPRSLCTPESARVYPPRHLGIGRTRTQAARGNRRKPYPAADPASRDAPGPGADGTLAKKPAGLIRARELGLPGRSSYFGRDSEGPEHAPEKRGGPSTREAKRRAGEGEAFLT